MKLRKEKLYRRGDKIVLPFRSAFDNKQITFYECKVIKQYDTYILFERTLATGVNILGTVQLVDLKNNHNRLGWYVD